MIERTVALPAGLQRALTLHPSGGSPALAALLAGVATSRWESVAWQASLLTPGGFPVELSFSTASPATFRYTVDAAPPELAPSERLGFAQAALGQLGVDVGHSALLGRLGGAQREGHPRWGAWIGGRHAPGLDRFKLYLEVPRGQVGPARSVFDRVGGLRIVGLETEGGAVELYYRVGRLEVDVLRAMLRAEGLEHRLDDMLALLGQVTHRSVIHRLPGSNLVVSVAGPAVSVIAHCQELLGADHLCRARLLALADERGWDLSAYRDISEPLQEPAPRGSSRHHTTVALTARPEGDLNLVVGLRPPAPPTNW